MGRLRFGHNRAISAAAIVVAVLAVSADRDLSFSPSAPVYAQSATPSDGEREGTADQLNADGLKAFQKGRYAEAEALFKRALIIQERMLGPKHPATATTLNELARAYRELARYSDAEALLKRALSIQESTLGPEDLSVAKTLNATNSG